ncbi:MAG TPA: hypothetical protein VHB46_09980, partial [Burkholderiales bacterium]|nr:hypothetical protein [Burkholderiales bacterium]
DADRLRKIAQVWRPWRGVAAHLMWAYYHAVKKREGISLEPKAKPGKAAAKRKTKAKVKGKSNGRTRRAAA